MFDPKQEDFISSRKEIFIMKTVHTDKAPAAIGPYSQAIIHGDTLYTSGQIPVDPATGEVVGTTIEEQADRVMKNLGAVLETAGSSY